MDPVVIEVAINGVTTPDQNPNVPLDPAAIADEARACLAAGAAIIHAHNHDMGLTGADAAAPYVAAFGPVLDEHPDALWYPTLTSRPDIEGKTEHVPLIAAAVPLRIAAVDPGSVNIGLPDAEGLPIGGVYANSYADIRYALELCGRHRLGPTLAIYEPGFLQCVLSYHRAGRLPAGSMPKLYFGGPYGVLRRGAGVTFGLPPSELALRAYLEMLEGTGLPWSVSVWGGDLMATPVAELAVRLGGHLHVGLEEFWDPHRRPTNVALVAEAVALCERVGRSVATGAETATIIGLP